MRSRIDIEGGGDLRRRGVGAAGVVGPCYEVIAAETGLAHHILEGDVGCAGHGDIERPAGRAIGIAGGVEQYLEIGAFHHLVLVAVVDHGKTRRHIGLRELLQQLVHSAWMVWYFRSTLPARRRTARGAILKSHRDLIPHR
jgi:hypothetical protein